MKIVTAASHDILERGRCNSNAPELVSPTRQRQQRIAPSVKLFTAIPRKPLDTH
jgi:hypothetical protein